MTSELPSPRPTPLVSGSRETKNSGPAEQISRRQRVLPYAVPRRKISRPFPGTSFSLLGTAAVFGLMVLSAVAYAVTN